MPGLDRTGPEGQGSRTGRQLGKCTNNDSGGLNQETPLGKGPERVIGKGMGRGMGRGAGRAGRAARQENGRRAGRGPGRNSGQN